ncbi:MAG TPA: CmcJ/NvfI family oxidoreductase [Sporolactobacillaceae bacterium]|nr:CmcJ/NvfI family oxidoreductase [Sporolactobacillaceae bacterium]
MANLNTENQSAPDHVNGVLNYLADRNDAPITYTYQPPPGVAARSGNYAKYSVAIHNARAVLSQLSLDRQGFAVAYQETAVANFYDEEEVRTVYYPEVERLVKEFTGAVKVHVFDHNVRCRPMAKRRENGAQEPVKVAHNDYTLKSGPQRVRDLLPNEAEALIKNRFAVINVWRPISGPVQESPLAVCDAQSMLQEDFVKHVLRYRDRDGEVYSVAYNPNHRWYYIPNQKKEEVLLLKCYDSDDNRARFTAHSAFEDPTSPHDAAPRESVEVRTLVFFSS